MIEFCLLWDIDGTLLNTHGAGVKPLERAILDVFGYQVALERGRYSGYTDYEIIADLVESDLNDDSVSEKFEEVLNKYTQDLKAALILSPASPLGKIKETLRELRFSTPLKSFIGTGNFEPAASVKLESVGLQENFLEKDIFGATSSRKRRVEIINYAASKLIADCTPIVIGDAPADIFAAKKNNLGVIATPTGHHSYDELNSILPGLVLRPDWSTEDLMCKLDVIAKQL
jgi:phosphoglycolate phosphatase